MASLNATADDTYIHRVILMGDVIDNPRIGTSDIRVARFRLQTRKGRGLRFSQTHQIAIFDPSLIDYTLDNVKRHSRVFVEGEINHQYRDNGLFSADIIPKIIVLLAD